MPSLRRAVTFLAFALLALDAWSQGVGRGQFVSGRVEVERGTQRLPLQAGAEVQEGDVVLGAADGPPQLGMPDAACASVPPDSPLRSQAYAVDASEPPRDSPRFSLT